MSYTTQQLRDSLNSVLQESESRHSMLEHRLFKLEAFMRQAEPYINAMVLIDPEPKKEDQ